MHSAEGASWDVEVDNQKDETILRVSGFAGLCWDEGIDFFLGTPKPPVLRVLRRVFAGGGSGDTGGFGGFLLSRWRSSE